jgi:hypothetical protein
MRAERDAAGDGPRVWTLIGERFSLFSEHTASLAVVVQPHSAARTRLKCARAYRSLIIRESVVNF